jgi:BirA family biotin operon repressor/biotin-[acetyl-CoA-carboxylase] ligase
VVNALASGDDHPIPPPPFARTLVRLDIIDSTNDHARRLLLASGVELPLLVLARRQTAGRGRGSHEWWSDAGSLTFTIALDPAAHGLRPEHEPKLALAAAVAVVEAIEAVATGAVPLGIRWPNDVEAAGRKLGGILPERVETDDGPRLMIGIGLNVATRLDEAPAAIRVMATSIEALRAGPVEPGGLLDAILHRFGRGLGELACDAPALVGRWARLDTLEGQRIRIDFGSRVVAGIGRGIAPDGGLRLETPEGIVTLHGGQVLRESPVAPPPAGDGGHPG